MNTHEIVESLGVLKTAFDMLRSARGLLPGHERHDDIPVYRLIGRPHPKPPLPVDLEQGKP